MPEIRFTPEQTQVLSSRDQNLLVSAAAGSGKTAVLVERILRRITDPVDPIDVDELLVVTFTRAAAREMKERLTEALGRAVVADPGNRRLSRQETLLQSAQITTIDGFCAYLLRNHFSEIGLDPGFRLMDELESRLRLEDALDAYLEEKYAQGEAAFLRCSDIFAADLTGEGFKKTIRALYTEAMSQPWPVPYLLERGEDYAVGSAEDLLARPETGQMLETVAQTLTDLGREYKELLRISETFPGPSNYAEGLRKDLETVFAGAEELARRCQALRNIEEAAPRAAAGRELWELLSERLGHGLARLSTKKAPEGEDPQIREAVKERRKSVGERLKELRGRFFALSPEETVQIYAAMAGDIRALCRATAEFAEFYQRAKMEEAMLDFSDLEHLSLELLLPADESGKRAPGPVALAYRSRFREIMIDEYQDSNEVQELLLSTLAGESEGRYDRFMVGDVKQSIYKFRLAKPEIFIEKYVSYAAEAGAKRRRIDLDRNFRSRQEVVDVVNAIFRRIMRPEIGGVLYDEAAALKAGAVYPESSGEHRAELLMVETKGEPDKRLAEARAVAARIRELMALRIGAEQRPADFGDVAVLLRSVSGGWDEAFRLAFEEAGIPCSLRTRAGYFEATEIRQIVAYLKVLDNPLQDIPLYGALHGFFGGFSEEEIAQLAAGRQGVNGELYMALQRAAGYGDEEPEPGAEPGSETGRKFGAQAKGPAAESGSAVDLDPALTARFREFYESLMRRRSEMRRMEMYPFLNLLFEETGYATAMRAMPGGEQRSANLRLFIRIAEDYGRTGYSGLFHFLRYLDAMQQREMEMGEAALARDEKHAVQIMTIHKSKGLEFPIVVVAGLGRNLGGNDQNGSLLVDGQLGLGADYTDPERRVRGSTLRKEVVRERIRRENMGEEIRVLYVALTRAREKLVLSMGAKDIAALEARYKDELAQSVDPDGRLSVSAIREARTEMELILRGILAAEEEGFPTVDRIETVPQPGGGEARDSEARQVFERELSLAAENFRRFGDRALAMPEMARMTVEPAGSDMAGIYAKTTVSAIKRMAALSGDGLEEMSQECETPSHHDFAALSEPEVSVPEFIAGKSPLTGAARGSALHRILEKLPLGERERFMESEDAVAAWLDAQVAEGFLLPAERESLSARELYRFVSSGLAADMAAADAAGRLYREQPFVLRVPASRLYGERAGEETVLIQGIIDAFYLEADGGIVLLDYKTDRVRSGETLRNRYAKQLELYEEALTKLMKRPVTKRLIYAFFMGKTVPV